MPEGSETMLMANYLNKEFKDKLCVNLLLCSKSKYFNKPLKGFTSEQWIPINGVITIPVNMICNCVESYGKKIGFFFDNHCFIFSLGLEGHFQLELGNNTGICISFENKNIYYDDSRRFGNFYYIHRSELSTIMKNVGPDYLRGEVSLELFCSVIKNPKISHHEIVWFLMNQKYFSGCGVYIKCDALYLARISPYRILSSLTDNDLSNLYHSIMRILTESFRANGKTIATYKNIDGTPGTFTNYCYGLKHDVNGFPIIRCTLSDKRTSHWCPSLQK